MNKVIVLFLGLLLSFQVSAVDYKNILTGKVLRIDGADCAGISLKNSRLYG